MKNSIVATLLVGGLACSFGAFATNIESGVAITPAECALLGENVQLNLSNNVSGAYNCNVATSTIVIAACHAAGSRNPATVQCANSGTEQAPDWNDPSCSADTDTFEITDFRGYRASSRGGRVGAANLGGNCTEGSVDALVN